MSDSVRPHRRQSTRLPRPWDFPGKNTGVGCHFLLQCMKVKSDSEVAQSCPTLSDPMDCSLPGSSIHGIFQARVLEWVAIAFSVILLRSRVNSSAVCIILYQMEKIFFVLYFLLDMWQLLHLVSDIICFLAPSIYVPVSVSDCLLGSGIFLRVITRSCSSLKLFFASH